MGKYLAQRGAGQLGLCLLELDQLLVHQTPRGGYLFVNDPARQRHFLIYTKGPVCASRTLGEQVAIIPSHRLRFNTILFSLFCFQQKTPEIPVALYLVSIIHQFICMECFDPRKNHIWFLLFSFVCLFAITAIPVHRGQCCS